MAVKNLTYNSMSFKISYDILNPTAQNDFIILHGWGSNKEIMKMAFEKQLPNFRHIYIDMPGFGKSNNDYVLTTDDYVQILDVFLKTVHAKKFAIAGHSYGGKVATLLNPEHLILLSSAGILEEKSSKVKTKIKMAKFFNALGLSKITKAFRSKDVEQMSEHMYSTFKNVVNEDFTQYFKNYKGNALVFWGISDTATSLTSGQTISNLIPNSTFKSYEGDHYFFTKHSKEIADTINNAIL